VYRPADMRDVSSLIVLSNSAPNPAHLHPNPLRPCFGGGINPTAAIGAKVSNHRLPTSRLGIAERARRAFRDLEIGELEGDVESSVAEELLAGLQSNTISSAEIHGVDIAAKLTLQLQKPAREAISESGTASS